MNQTDLVREYARNNYVEPARAQGAATVEIIAGDVEKGIHLRNRTPLVCQALKSRKFLEQNHLTLEKIDGPASGLSTTVKFIYRLAVGPADASRESQFRRLRGIGKEVFQSLGGGEAFIRGERAAWNRGEDS